MVPEVVVVCDEVANLLLRSPGSVWIWSLSLRDVTSRIEFGEA